MSGSIIEKAAKAIYEKRNGAGCKPWARLPKAHKEPYLLDARAALEAIREPTLEMLDEGNRSFRQAHSSGISGMTIEAQIRSETFRFDAGWKAAIDAALNEQEAG